MKFVIGIDEAGRGALAGPVSVGVALIPTELTWDDFPNLADSKKLSQKRREEWLQKIEEDDRINYAVALVDALEIDDGGIVPACTKAAHMALDQLSINKEDVKVLLDAGLKIDDMWQQESFVKGDEIIPVIALASIVAKVSRDRFMENMANSYPEYAFEVHKGYGTKKHRESIALNGLSDVHRKTFCTRLIVM